MHLSACRAGAGLLLLAAAGIAEAAPAAIPEVVVPTLAGRAADLRDFVPAGWAVEQSASGDLNRDGRADRALVLRQQEPRNVIADSALRGTEPLDTNPRVLAVALADGAGWRLVAQDHALIPRHDAPNLDDPFDGIAIARGVLDVRLRHWASAGSWETGQRTFRFRHDGRCMRLIGLEVTSMHRGSGETTDTSINLLTGRIEARRGNVADDRPPRPAGARRYARGTPPCLEAVGDGFAFDHGPPTR